MKLLIIIPAFNESVKMAEVIAGISRRSKPDGDILVVDDGSNDDTAEVAKKAGAIVLRHKLNRGQGAALKTGLVYASRFGYDTAVFFDADGQMAPEEINSLAEKLAQGYDVVLGSRNLGQAIAMPKIKKAVKYLALIFTRLTTGLAITDTHIGFQAWSAIAMERINLDQDRMAHASQILSEISRCRLKYAEVPVTIKYSDYSLKKGQSSWGLFRILWDLLIK